MKLQKISARQRLRGVYSETWSNELGELPIKMPSALGPLSSSLLTSLWNAQTSQGHSWLLASARPRPFHHLALTVISPHPLPCHHFASGNNTASNHDSISSLDLSAFCYFSKKLSDLVPQCFCTFVGICYRKGSTSHFFLQYKLQTHTPLICAGLRWMELSISSLRNDLKYISTSYHFP